MVDLRGFYSPPSDVDELIGAGISIGDVGPMLPKVDVVDFGNVAKDLKFQLLIGW